LRFLTNLKILKNPNGQPHMKNVAGVGEVFVNTPSNHSSETVGFGSRGPKRWARREQTVENMADGENSEVSFKILSSFIHLN